MRIDKLFKVLVVGGSVLTAGCNDERVAPVVREEVTTADAGVRDAAVPSADVASARDVGIARDVPAARDVAARADGVSSWMSWFVDPVEEDAGPDDVGVADAGTTSDAAEDAADDATADGGVFAWLSWV